MGGIPAAFKLVESRRVPGVQHHHVDDRHVPARAAYASHLRKHGIRLIEVVHGESGDNAVEGSVQERESPRIPDLKDNVRKCCGIGGALPLEKHLGCDVDRNHGPDQWRKRPSVQRGASGHAGIGTIDIPRAFFDDHPAPNGRVDAGIDHAYAVTSYAVQGATYEASTSHIDERSTRAETYVDITRGRQNNTLYATRQEDPLDGEHLPKAPPIPLETALAIRLSHAEELTAWELAEHTPPTTERDAISL